MIQWFKEHKYIVIGASVALVVLVAAFFLGGPKSSKSADGVGATTEEAQDNTTLKHTEGETTEVSTATEYADVSSDETKVDDNLVSVTTATATTIASTDASTTASTTEATTQATTQATTEAVTFNCSITISCSDILNHMDNLKAEKAGLIPANGLILSTTVTVTEGETVMDVLRRACSDANVIVDASSGYVRGIQNIYERDCGTTSGWMYCVNGVYPNYGAASYVLKEGDSIQWNYSCSE